ncbi:MAG: ChuX/HutX family heme-like substrate-binding protein [Bacteroidia bacterium]|nr:hypothetical protein [Bacteroidia bacterium]MDW8014904.1 ChuX/HutX family heme-like substrate-binding protein [Bacteroidia bacterium]
MTSIQDLREAFQKIRQEAPSLYLREIAQRLGVSEMEVLRLEVGKSVFRLHPDIPRLLAALSTLGPLKALSRNEWAVIETIGTYPTPSIEGGVMIFAGSPIDLRIYLAHWRFAFAVKSFAKDGRPLYSFQFFTGWGEAIHKVYLTSADQVPQWEALTREFLHEDQVVEAEVLTSRPSEPSPEEVEKTHFLKAWEALEDTHEFGSLLKRFGLTRARGVKMAEGTFTWLLPEKTPMLLLQWAISSQTPLMFFVGNAGIHHIYSGQIHTLSSAHGWINVLEPDFNLHLNPAGFSHTYLVRKPTREGDIYSIEIFGPQQEEVLWIFGARKPGTSVPSAWREYVEQTLLQSALA